MLLSFAVRSRVCWLFGLAALAGLFMGPSMARADPHETHTVRVPILMYHYVRVVSNPRDRVGLDLSVTPYRFGQEMALLYGDGFHTITLDDLLAAIYDDASLPSRPIILTFDDGYDDFYTTAEPILSQYGFKATSFIITGKVGQAHYMTWQEIKQLSATGLVDFESHTVDHSDMLHMSSSHARVEMSVSKQTLKQELGTPIEFLAYPAGHYNSATLSELYPLGYRAGIGTAYGTWHGPADIRALTRMRIHGSDTLYSFAAKLGVSAR